MKKIASPQELRTELHRLLTYTEETHPSRQMLATELYSLANRMAASSHAVVDNAFNKGVAEAEEFKEKYGPSDWAPPERWEILRREKQIEQGKLLDEHLTDVISTLNTLRKNLEPWKQKWLLIEAVLDLSEGVSPILGRLKVFSE